MTLAVEWKSAKARRLSSALALRFGDGEDRARSERSWGCGGPDGRLLVRSGATGDRGRRFLAEGRLTGPWASTIIFALRTGGYVQFDDPVVIRGNCLPRAQRVDGFWWGKRLVTLEVTGAVTDRLKVRLRRGVVTMDQSGPDPLHLAESRPIVFVRRGVFMERCGGGAGRLPELK